MLATSFPLLTERIRAGAEVQLTRNSTSVDVSLQFSDVDFSPQSQAFSSALRTLEKHLSGEDTATEDHIFIDLHALDRANLRPIDLLPIKTGSDLNLRKHELGGLELSIQGWSGERRANFVGRSIEQILDRVDLALVDEEFIKKLYKDL